MQGNHGRAALSAFVLVGLFAGQVSARTPEIEVVDKGHRYKVWLEPLLEDGTKPPLQDVDIARYCSIAQGFAERMWRLTNGRHRVFQVEFDYSIEPPAQYQITWHRYHGTSNAQHGVEMHDSIVGAKNTWTEQPTGTADFEECNDTWGCHQANCPPGLSYVPLPGEPGRATCQDAFGQSPLDSPQVQAFTLAHEVAHEYYASKDEYVGENQANALGCSFLIGFRTCANPTDWHTSIMSSRKADYWCDKNTHFYDGRFIGTSEDTPFEGSIFIPISENMKIYGDQWTRAGNEWAELQNYMPGDPVAHETGSTPNNEYFKPPSGVPLEPWEPLPTDEFCVFVRDDVDTAVMNDLMVVVDKSATMGYRSTALDVTAFEAAFAAGLGQFNRTTQNRASGISVFDYISSRLVPYQPPSAPRAISEFPLVASGQTNLCDAISDAALQIRAAGTADAVGHMLLLTDALPTTANCSTAQAVRDAATAACSPADGSKPVGISVVAYGAADYGLIQQITDICGGVARQTDRTPTTELSALLPDGYATPLDIKLAMSRLAYQMRGYQEAMFANERLPAVFERSFNVAPGTRELEVAWMGEQTEYTPFEPPPIAPPQSVPGNAQGTNKKECEFEDDYLFELVDPNGNIVGTDVVPTELELEYLTRTRRVSLPTPGLWTMRVTGGEPCVVGGEQPAPQVAMFANFRSGLVKGSVQVEDKALDSNQSGRVTAFLKTGTDTAATNISVTARLVNGEVNYAIQMFDDGTHGGDEVASDGLYTGTINSTCTSGILDPGAYRLLVEFESSADTAVPVVLPIPDVQVAYGANGIPPGGAISASVVTESMVTIGDCNSPTPGCDGVSTVFDLCEQGSATVDGDVEVDAGGTTPDITVTVFNCPIASSGVTVGVGPGVYTSNVRSTYDDATGIGTVVFDATAIVSAPSGEYPVSIFWGRERCNTTGAVIPVNGCPSLPDYDGDGIGDMCDNNSLVADAGEDQILECDGAGKASVLLDGSGSGAPSGALLYAWEAPIPLVGQGQAMASGQFPVGTTEATLTVSQDGVSASDSVIISVVDTLPPTLSVPGDVTAANCTGVNLGQATAIDDCGSAVTITNNAPASFKAGITLVTWTAVDSYGNAVSKNQKVTVGLGNDPSCCPLGSSIMLGTPNNDTLIGTSGVDCVFGFGGQDVLRGVGGDDFLNAGDGDDVVEGGDGNDLIDGGTGQDTLRGQNGNDTLYGKDGDDWCYGGDGDDTTYGGQGQDHLYGETGNDSLYGEDGDDKLDGAVGDDLLVGGGLHDVCTGGPGANVFLSCEKVQ